MAVNPIPEGYHTITPYVHCENVAKLIDFLKEAFGAKEKELILGENSVVAHAEIKIGNSMIMLAEATGDKKAQPVDLYLYVDDTDATYKKAIECGATSVMEPADQFYGDRNAGIKDLSGNQWFIATHIEDVSPEEMQKRSQAQAKK